MNNLNDELDNLNLSSLNKSELSKTFGGDKVSLAVLRAMGYIWGGVTHETTEAQNSPITGPGGNKYM
ncbi:hypothetical protein [Fodinibius sp. Rm-B-1B1-1]|uniref:hypothetical protein n=1 Tax=Fodinibius alkaliphilus TaxID=3140241 RepID=UPI00315A4ACB